MSDIKQQIENMSPDDIAEVVSLLGKKFTIMDSFLDREKVVESFSAQLTGDGLNLLREIIITAMYNQIQQNKERVNET